MKNYKFTFILSLFTLNLCVFVWPYSSGAFFVNIIFLITLLMSNIKDEFNFKSVFTAWVFISYILQYSLFVIYNYDIEYRHVLEPLFTGWLVLVSETSIDKALEFIFYLILSLLIFNLTYRDKLKNESYKRGTLKFSNFFLFQFLFVVLFFVSSFFRYYFSLHVHEQAVSLPFKLAAIINYSNTFLFYAIVSIFISYDVYNYKENNRSLKLTKLSFIFCIIHYSLFLSKISIVYPLFVYFSAQFIFKIKITNVTKIAILVAVFLLVYPVLNYIRFAISAGVSEQILTTALGNFTRDSNTTSIKSIMIYGLLTFISRVVGSEPLMISIEAYQSMKVDWYYFLLNGFPIDSFITKEFLGASEGYGYSSGFGGSLYFLSGGTVFFILFSLCWLYFSNFVLTRLILTNKPLLKFLTPFSLFFLIIYTVGGISGVGFLFFILTIFIMWVFSSVKI